MVLTLNVGKEADPQVFGLKDQIAVGLHPAVGDAERQFGPHDALDVDAVFELLDVIGDLAGEADVAAAERPAAAGRAAPAEEKPGHLPERVEPKAPRHHRIALEMASEEPEVRIDVELGPDDAAVVAAALGGDLGDAVEHQH